MFRSCLSCQLFEHLSPSAEAVWTELAHGEWAGNISALPPQASAFTLVSQMFSMKETRATLVLLTQSRRLASGGGPGGQGQPLL